LAICRHTTFSAILRMAGFPLKPAARASNIQ
jgi:hypothetical protein